MIEPKRISIFTGHFGSGKTEIAINYALRLNQMGKDVVIIDFDIVNPYFRTKDVEDFLTQKGIQVISPGYANSNIENPALPPEINLAFDDRSKYVVFDVGGDEDGATPLGRYHQEFQAEPYDLFFVLNERRMLTASVEDTLMILREIEAVSRLRVNALISNTHLKEFTTPDVVLEGQKLAEQFSKETKLPIAYISGRPEILDQLPERYQDLKFPLDLYINLNF